MNRMKVSQNALQLQSSGRAPVLWCRTAMLCVLLAAWWMGPELAAEENPPEGTDSAEYSITTLSYRVAVPAADRFIQAMEDYARAGGGYLVRRNGGQLVLRVPRKLGRAAIDKEIKSIPGTQVLQDARDSQEVTTRLVDLRAKYRVARQNLDKLRALSKTAGLDDLLDLEKALSQQLQEVENLKGEIRYLEEMSALYTLQLSINQGGRTSDPERVPIPWIRDLNLQGVLK